MTPHRLAAVLLIAGVPALGLLPLPGWAVAVASAIVALIAAWSWGGGRPVRPEVERVARPSSRGADPPTDSVAQIQPAGAPAIGPASAQPDSLGSDRHGSARTLLDAIHVPVVAADDRGRLTLCNAAAVALIGAPAERLVGRPVEEVFTQADLLRLHAEARQGRPGRGRVRIARADGVGVFEASATPLAAVDAGEGGKTHPVVMTLQDVTEPARSVQVKTDFVANASHELRTPIAALKLAAETFQSGAADDPAMRDRLITAVADNTLRLEELVRDLLDLSKLESPDVPLQLGPVRGSELRRTLAPMFEPVCAERRITLAFDLDPALERLTTDRELVLLILKNLIDNAAKFAYEGTEVRIVGRPTPGPGAPGEPGGVKLDVIDQGVGIPLAQQQRIFERFYQVDQARTGTAPRRGTGLGLAIVKHAVRNLGGSIRVHSVWKQGTTMTVELPGILPPDSSDAAQAGGTL